MPKITGTKVVGTTVKVVTKGWKAKGVSVRYAWKVNGKTVKVGASTKYKIVKKDAGKRLTVTVIGKKSGFKTVSKTSAKVAVLTAFKKVPVPVISGTLTVGSSISAKATGFKPAATGYSYAWKIDGKSVANGTGKTYTLTRADAGKTVSVVVSGKRAGYLASGKASYAGNIAAVGTGTEPGTDTSTSASGTDSTTESASTSTPAATVTAPANTAKWISGSSGVGSSNGQFDVWRGSEDEITGTWSDDNANMVQFWPLQSSGPLANWDKPIDVAIGGISADETWAAAATGAYDSRWIASLKKLQSLRSNKSGTTYIRFAHEMNGNWYPWAVNTTNYLAFMEAWKHFRSLQKTYFPDAQLVFNVNRESVGTGMDWRDFFPGKAYVDVLSVDYYNHWPYVGTADDWTASLSSNDAYGAPKGLAKHLEFAKSQGLPLAVSEWAGMASSGDSAAFVTGMHDFFEANAGTGAGKLLYEIYFNVDRDSSNFSIYGSTVRMPKAAAEYQRLF